MAALKAELSDLKPVSRVLHGLRLPRLSIIRPHVCVCAAAVCVIVYVCFQDNVLSGCDILETRTLELAQRIQLVQDPVEAEELRFKSALCLFLSQRDTEELKAVVLAALKVLPSGLHVTL
jgi:hypothetical protein